MICKLERWPADPLAHPDIRRMSQRELADLPLEHPLPEPLLCEAGAAVRSPLFRRLAGRLAGWRPQFTR